MDLVTLPATLLDQLGVSCTNSKSRPETSPLISGENKVLKEIKSSLPGNSLSLTDLKLYQWHSKRVIKGMFTILIRTRYENCSKDILFVLSLNYHHFRLTRKGSQTSKSSLKLFQSQEKLTKMVFAYNT